MGLSEANPGGAIGLESCPRCGYSLQGSPPAGACPECGFSYDEATFVLAGVARGVSNLSAGRVLLWVFVIGAAWLGFTGAGVLLSLVAMGGGRVIGPAAACIVLAWVGAVAYLVLTRRRESRGGMQHVLFAADGFGDVTGLAGTDEERARWLVTWDRVDTVRIDRLGSQFHRLRIGRGDGARVRRATLDLNLGCDADRAERIRSAIESRLLHRPPASPGGH